MTLQSHMADILEQELLASASTVSSSETVSVETNVASEYIHSDSTSFRHILEADIIRIVASVMKIPDARLDADASLIDFGVDSLSITGISNALSKQYHCDIPATMILEAKTLNEFIDILIRRYEESFAKYYHQVESNQGAHTVEHPQVESKTIDEWITKSQSLVISSKPKAASHSVSKVSITSSASSDDKSSVNDRIFQQFSDATFVHVVDNYHRKSEWISVGEGDPIVFIPGLGTTADVWESQIRYFSDRHRVLIYHPPGHGESDMSNTIECFDDIVSMLCKGLDVLRVDRPVPLVGWSLGSTLALEIAIQYPERVRSLGLICAAPKKVADGLPMKDLNALSSSQHDLVLSRLSDIHTNGVSTRYKHLYTHWDCRSSVKNISCPTWIMSGSLDEYIPEMWGEDLHQRLSHSTFIRVKDGGHFIPFTHRKRVTMMIKKMVQGAL